MKYQSLFSQKNTKNISKCYLLKFYPACYVLIRYWNAELTNYVLFLRLSLFVCVEVLRPSQPNGVMLSAVSLPNHTFTGQALSSKRLTSIVHILSPETDKCPS